MKIFGILCVACFSSVLCTPPLWKITHHDPSVLCTPPFEKSPIKAHRFCVLPPLKNHPSWPIGFVYSPLWKMTVFGGCLFRGGRLLRQIRYIDLNRTEAACIAFIVIWFKKDHRRLFFASYFAAVYGAYSNNAFNIMRRILKVNLRGKKHLIQKAIRRFLNCQTNLCFSDKKLWKIKDIKLFQHSFGQNEKSFKKIFQKNVKKSLKKFFFKKSFKKSFFYKNFYVLQCSSISPFKLYN